MLVTLRVIRVNIVDGACSHTAIALCDLDATIRRNELETSTVVSYLWVKLKIITENAVPMEDVKLQKSEYGKKTKDCHEPHDSKPPCSLTQSFQEKLCNTLLEAAPSCVTLYFMTIPPVQAVNEEEHLDQITPANIDHEEIVEYAKVSSVKELAEMIIAQNNFTTFPNPTYEQCSNFLEFLHNCKFETEAKF